MPFPRSFAGGAKLIGVSAAALSLAACSGPAVNGAYTDNEALAEMEAFVADTFASLEDFPGFERRLVKVIDCLYGMDDSLTEEGYDVVSLRYQFSEADGEDPLLRETYPEQLAERWEELGHEVRVNHDDDGSISNLTVRRDDGFAMTYNIWDTVWLTVFLSGDDCVAIADGDLEIPEPQGGVTEDNDLLEGFGPRVD